MLDIRDTGEEQVCVLFRGYRYEQHSNESKLMLAYDTCHPNLSYPPNHSYTASPYYVQWVYKMAKKLLGEGNFMYSTLVVTMEMYPYSLVDVLRGVKDKWEAVFGRPRLDVIVPYMLLMVCSCVLVAFSL